MKRLSSIISDSDLIENHSIKEKEEEKECDHELYKGYWAKCPECGKDLSGYLSDY